MNYMHWLKIAVVAVVAVAIANRIPTVKDYVRG